MIEKPWRPADWTNLIPVERPRSLEPGIYPVFPEPEESMDPDEPEFQLEDFTRTEYILVALFAGILLLVAVVVGLAMYGHPAPVVSN